MSCLESLLDSWTKPSSDTEQEKQERTERMIRKAVKSHPRLRTMNCKIYAKGSYANNTNVKADSDVDIAVECQEVFYYDAENFADLGGKPYQGIWTPENLRNELVAALTDEFGSSVDTSGSTAIQVHSSTARVEADVVPCFSYRYYFSQNNYVEGAKVFKRDGTSVVNYPERQKNNGTRKNYRTGHRYKKMVRIVKRLENEMVNKGVCSELPSYFIECLVYNCPDHVFALSTWVERLEGVLWAICNSEDDWMEVNEMSFLFREGQKWTREGGKDFATAALKFLCPLKG